MIAYQIKQFHGFTLIELIITITIAGILFSLAIPSFSHMLAHNQQTSVLHTLFKHLNVARNEAINTNHHVLLCKSVDGKHCITQSSWDDGWLIFTDNDNNKKVNDEERVIYSQQSLPSHIFLDYRGFGSNNYFRYYPDGHGSANGTFTLCNHSNEKLAQSIIISRTGRVRINTKSGSGKALICG
ncbi:MAG: GspH/FimT family protein [gamma proteobacterium symbiont of Bathyaustriella thionipta]|nr:GspH/FimT family protein [gamma proteobacterium symbiont of Bathyaustriella thionipta]MCU7950877.1 GspH/FimT family protein [gamma proteobacterium symbiont of Bathyaustriella thionipta]MCU7952299.1 GspH/FimT family protein [gamma proteobacterium symbiont of Bathyaustriella thionipta]MCU7957379.1 GspH/FimT family protein [gamma proteobacterium symbiont of Bathyaustriella thionipta]MCU7965949.1 GspH/FimT family protein [gamma proteobacterium symbiont of Bathyaustriella thionipta]